MPDTDLKSLSKIWSELSDNKFSLNETGEQSLNNFLKYLEPDEVYEAMIIASEKIESSLIEDRYKYFCGICWRKIKGDYTNMNEAKS